MFGGNLKSVDRSCEFKNSSKSHCKQAVSHWQHGVTYCVRKQVAVLQLQQAGQSCSDTFRLSL